ncbi:MAG: MBL fold metallo-hydrolase [candidate division Zixibacteria bacterium]|nr:MBL fold metallo-hydrolase [candidate division Zixibacteria bacterium]
MDYGDNGEKRTTLILLGTGTPNAEPARAGPSAAVVVGEQPYVVDFGPGVVRRAVAAGLDPKRLTRAFLTHLHSDHTAGYPDLILTPWTLEREEPLEVYGPPGLEVMTERLLAAYGADVKERVAGLEPANETGWRVAAHDVDPGVVYRDDDVAVEAFAVDHGSWAVYGYKFQTADRAIVISSDTAPTEIIVEKSRGCDILAHEVYSVAGFETLTPAWQKYHAAVHTSSRELAELASRAEPKLLVLYHQLLWGVSYDELVAEVKESYGGEVVSGRDLDVF